MMKLPTSAFSLSLACIFVFLLFAGLECNNNSEDPNSDCIVFKNHKLTWRPIPVDDSDQPLNPSENFIGLGGDNNQYCLYWFTKYNIEGVCLREAIIITITIEIKEEYKDYFSTLGGAFRWWLDGNSTSHDKLIEDFTYNTSGGIYTAIGKHTMSGDANAVTGGSFLCRALVYMHTQTDIETTNDVLNNAVISITLDWAYTEL